MTDPRTFATEFLKQPFPYMGLAPSSAVTKTGGTYIQEGTGRNELGVSGQTMWARIASSFPLGWSISGVLNTPKTAAKVGQVAATKAAEGAQAVEGKVKSVVEPARQFLSGAISYSKWLVVGLVAVAFIVFAAQVKTLVKS